MRLLLPSWWPPILWLLLSQLLLNLVLLLSPLLRLQWRQCRLLVLLLRPCWVFGLWPMPEPVCSRLWVRLTIAVTRAVRSMRSSGHAAALAAGSEP